MENNNKVTGKNVLKKRLSIVIIVGVFILSNIVFFYLGSAFTIGSIGLRNVSEAVAKDVSEIKDVKKYDLLFEVRENLLLRYNGEIDDNALLEAAIKGMTDSLNDPYTLFMNDKEYSSFVEQISGHFVGIGIQVGIKDEKVTVIAPIEGSPAERVGLKSGDVILKVNGEEMAEPKLENTVSKIKGEAGTSVDLTISRGEEVLDVTIPREEIKTTIVKGEILEDNVGYIRLSSFDEDSAKQVKEKILQLKGEGMKGLILDLRGNPGGSLSEAIGIASEFVPKGKVVTYTIDKYDKKQEYKSVGGDAQGLPLVVLIDGGSASASEVLTGALRDYELATIIGTKSFGKGVVQQLINLKDDKGGLKVTTSKYYTPNGENIHKIGITPDIEVTIPEETLNKEYDKSLDTQLIKSIEVIKEKLK
ncbi:S41 family peptidase [Clostridium sartagoforme]|uniref:S41 family peptidase n=1 Tax=Clostridium sartagoforme TaxID=84031 RepID=A0A4S2DH45_9CLOT|nr:MULTISPECIES: S41 family peptidase [Clostridium]MBS5939191.1 S41 family peptidase [Clostridium sp.]TGY41408.1 S41 family peptidase [Clostridium sartagoforme]